MSFSWQAEVWAAMKDNRISRAELADYLGFTPEYVSNVLNKKRNPSDAEQKFRAALQIIIEKKRSNKSRG